MTKLSSNTYYPISKSELEDYLTDRFVGVWGFGSEDYRASQEWQEAHPFAGSMIEEYGYYVKLSNFVTLKIYSGISRTADKPVSRGSGKDAIRIVVLCTKCGKPILGRQKRVHRVPTWTKNFDLRVEQILEELGSQIICAGCKKKCMLIKGVGENLLACPNPKTSMCSSGAKIIQKSWHKCTHQ